MLRVRGDTILSTMRCRLTNVPLKYHTIVLELLFSKRLVVVIIVPEGFPHEVLVLISFGTL
jgi:hypothetical protein